MYHYLIYISYFSWLFHVSPQNRRLHEGWDFPGFVHGWYRQHLLECPMQSRCSFFMAEWSNEAVPTILPAFLPHCSPTIWPVQPQMPQAPLLWPHPVIVSHSPYLAPSQTLNKPLAPSPRGKTRLAQFPVCEPRHSILARLWINFPGVLLSPCGTKVGTQQGLSMGYFPGKECV